MSDRNEELRKLLESQEGIFELARKELAFDITNADVVSMKIPGLMQKYAHLLVLSKAKLHQADADISSLRKELHEYYTSEYPRRIDRRDVEIYIEGDPRWKDARSKREYWKLKTEYIQIILDALEKASFNIGNAVKLAIYRGGN